MTELPDVEVDRHSPVPFYFQLAEILEEAISSGGWEAGQRVPSEPDICARYGLSRTTIRHALARLEHDGLISREKGRGTFVRSSEAHSWLIQTTEGFKNADLLRTRNGVTSQVLRLERGPLPRWAADALDLPQGAHGIVVERLRSIDGLVALYVVNHLPEHVADVVLGLDPNESLYQRLAERGGVSIIGGHRSVEAVTAGAKLAELLDVEPEAALAYVDSVSWDSERRPVDCYRAWLRTDRMRIRIQVSSRRSDGVQMPDLIAQALR